MYIALAQRTLEQRLKFYIDQIKTRGYFVYDECRFYPGKKIGFRNKDFHLGDSIFKLGAGYVLLERKDAGVGAKIIGALTLTKIPQFSTQWDTDVIFHLLDKMFGLRWRN